MSAELLELRAKYERQGVELSELRTKYCELAAKYLELTKALPPRYDPKYDEGRDWTGARPV